MKRMLSLLIVIMIAVVFISCQKEEVVMPILPETQPVEAKVTVNQPVDMKLYRAQMFGVALPSVEKFLEAFPSEPNLKSGSLDEKDLSVRIFSLDTLTYYSYVNNNNEIVVVKPIIYYELLHGYRKEYLTADQEFLVIGGKISTDSYKIVCKFANPYGKYFGLVDNNYISNIDYCFKFDDKNISPISYFGNGFNGQIKLAPIAGGHWELLVTKDDGDFRNQYSTGPIDYYGDYLLKLQYQLKAENTVSKIKVSPVLLNGANSIQIIGYDPETGNELYVRYLIPSNDGSSELNFVAPFDIAGIMICGENFGCWWYEAKIIGIGQGNISLYVVKQVAG